MAEVKKYFFLLAPMAYAVLAHARLIQGDLPAAESLLEKSHVNFDAYNFDGLQPYFVLITECRLALAQSDFERVGRVSEQLLSILRGAGVRVFVSDVLYSQGRMLLGCGRAEEAHNILEQARTMAEATGERLSLLKILSTLAEVEEKLGDTGSAQTWTSQARALAEQLIRDTPPGLQTFFLQFKSA